MAVWALRLCLASVSTSTVDLGARTPGCCQRSRARFAGIVRGWQGACVRAGAPPPCAGPRRVEACIAGAAYRWTTSNWRRRAQRRRHAGRARTRPPRRRPRRQAAQPEAHLRHRLRRRASGQKRRRLCPTPARTLRRRRRRQVPRLQRSRAQRRRLCPRRQPARRPRVSSALRRAQARRGCGWFCRPIRAPHSALGVSLREQGLSDSPQSGTRGSQHFLVLHISL